MDFNECDHFLYYCHLINQIDHLIILLVIQIPFNA